MNFPKASSIKKSFNSISKGQQPSHVKCCFKSLSSFSLSLSLSLSSLLFTEACFTALVIQVAFCPKFHQFLYFGLRFLSGHQFLLLVEVNSRSWQWEEQSSPSFDFRPEHESHLECQNPAGNAGSGWNSPELRTRQNFGGGGGVLLHRSKHQNGTEFKTL